MLGIVSIVSIVLCVLVVAVASSTVYFIHVRRHESPDDGVLRIVQRHERHEDDAHEEFVRQLKKIKTPKRSSVEYSGTGRRGVVLCAGGRGYVGAARPLVRALSDAGVPTEVWHKIHEKDTVGEFRSLKHVDVRVAPPHKSKFAIRELAVVHSHFEEVLLVDADAKINTNDIDAYFDQDSYVEDGIHFIDDEHVIAVDKRRVNVDDIAMLAEHYPAVDDRPTLWRQVLQS